MKQRRSRSKIDGEHASKRAFLGKSTVRQKIAKLLNSETFITYAPSKWISHYLQRNHTNTVGMMGELTRAPFRIYERPPNLNPPLLVCPKH